VDLDRPVSEELLSAAERRANEVVWQALPVHSRTVSRAEAVSLGVDVPPEARDDVRLVEAQGFDRQPCGGTHPANTAEVGVVVVLDHERYKGGTRVHFVCGHRALRVLGSQRQTLGDAARLLSCPWPQLAEAAERLLAQLGEVRRRAQDLALRAIAAEAQTLLSEVDPALVTTRVYEGWTADELRSLAERVVARRQGVVLLGSRAGGAYLCFAESAGLQHDIPGLVRDASLRLGGRGGGKGHVAQGRSDSAQGLEEVIAWAAAQIQRGPAPS
jgi:alanyl-tRNA synthetase